MRKVLFCLLVIVTLLPAAAWKDESGKQPDVKAENIHIYRQEDLILIDGVMVANRENPIRGLVVIFELLAPGERLISKQVTTATEDVLEAGEMVEFYVQCKDHVRAVSVRVRCKEDRGMNLSLDKTGPYRIE